MLYLRFSVTHFKLFTCKDLALRLQQSQNAFFFSNRILKDIPVQSETDNRKLEAPEPHSRLCLDMSSCYQAIITWHVLMNAEMPHLIGGKNYIWCDLFNQQSRDFFLPKTKKFLLTNLVSAWLKPVTAGVYNTCSHYPTQLSSPPTTDTVMC